MYKKLILIVSLVISGIAIHAQTAQAPANSVDSVTLVISGSGATKQDATHAALRNAIEQAYGVFVSAHTEILNDSLVRDEIITIASGNVYSYHELGAVLLPDSTHFVTLQAVVSTHKLAAYAQSKGVSCEFAGAVFGANLKLLELNQQNTQKAFQNLVSQLEAFIPYLYEKKLTVGNPDINGYIEFQVDFIDTDATRAFREMITSTCQALNMSDNEVQQLRSMSAHYYECIFESTKYRFYSEFPEDEINKIQRAARYCYYIKDNLDDYFSIIPLDASRTHELKDCYGIDYYIATRHTTENSITIVCKMDIERLTRINKFELKQLPEKYYYSPEDIIFDSSFVPLKKITTIEGPYQFEDLRAQNTPLLVYTDWAHDDTRFFLSKLAGEYENCIVVCDVNLYIRMDLKVGWDMAFGHTYLPMILYIKNDKIIKYINYEDYSEAAVRNLVESICK